MGYVIRLAISIGVLGSTFWVGMQADFSSYIVWMYEDPAWEPRLATEYLQQDIDDYFKSNWFLHKTAVDIVHAMSPEEKAGQVLIPAWESDQTLDEFIELSQLYHVGGVMVLHQNVSPKHIEQMYTQLELTVPQAILKPFVAIDGEPSLLPYRMPEVDTQEVVPTNALDTHAKVTQSALLIGTLLDEYGYNLNFAPVFDSAHNTAVIGNRSFGTATEEITARAGLFADVLKKQGVIPTAKHFPGHGYAAGDTHKQLEFIPGDLPEHEAFQYAVDRGIPVIMVGHLAIHGGDFDTGGLPATLSKTAVTHLLRETMGYEGVVVTDGMNMGALAEFDEVDIEALRAGVDLVLMPRDLARTHQQLVSKMIQDSEFEHMINDKLYRIVRLKLVQQWSHPENYLPAGLEGSGSLSEK